MEKTKKVRSTKFMPEETSLLIRLALNEKHIVENKTTDAEMWKLKANTWAHIAELFNASSECFRPMESLKMKYESIKKELKKKVNKNNAEALKTGGEKPEFIKIDGPEKELLDALGLSAHYIPSNLDSDSILPQSSEADTCATNTKREPLEAGQEICKEEMEFYNLQEVLEEENNIDCHENPSEDSSNEIILKFEPESPKMMEYIENNNESKKRVSRNYSPPTIKSKKPALHNPRQSKGEVLNKEVENLIELREELLRHQIHHVKTEEQRAQERNEREREKHRKEMELLDIEISIKKTILFNNNGLIQK